jgi:HSP20 family molecular chaperone IbpA
MDLHENTEYITTTSTLEFPGFKKKDVQIEVHKDDD